MNCYVFNIENLKNMENKVLLNTHLLLIHRSHHSYLAYFSPVFAWCFNCECEKHRCTGTQTQTHLYHMHTHMSQNWNNLNIELQILLSFFNSTLFCMPLPLAIRIPWEATRCAIVFVQQNLFKPSHIDALSLFFIIFCNN